MKLSTLPRLQQLTGQVILPFESPSLFSRKKKGQKKRKTEWARQYGWVSCSPFLSPFLRVSVVGGGKGHTINIVQLTGGQCPKPPPDFFWGAVVGGKTWRLPLVLGLTLSLTPTPKRGFFYFSSCRTWASCEGKKTAYVYLWKGS